MGVVKTSLVALVNLLDKNRPNQAQALEAGAPALLVKLARVKGDEVVMRAAFCMHVLAGGGEHREAQDALAEAGALPAVVSVRAGQAGAGVLAARGREGVSAAVLTRLASPPVRLSPPPAPSAGPALAPPQPRGAGQGPRGAKLPGARQPAKPGQGRSSRCAGTPLIMP